MESMYRSKSGRKSVSMRSFHEMQMQVQNLSVRIAQLEAQVAGNEKNEVQEEKEEKPVRKPRAKKSPETKE